MLLKWEVFHLSVKICSQQQYNSSRERSPWKSSNCAYRETLSNCLWHQSNLPFLHYSLKPGNQKIVKTSPCSSPLSSGQSLGCVCLLQCSPNACAAQAAALLLHQNTRLKDAAECWAVPCKWPFFTKPVNTKESWSWGKALFSHVLPGTGRLLYSI